jgi:predicted phage tail protein
MPGEQISIVSVDDSATVLTRGRVVDHQSNNVDLVLDSPADLSGGQIVVAMTHGDERLVSLAIVADGPSPEALSLRLIQRRD